MHLQDVQIGLRTAQLTATSSSSVTYLWSTSSTASAITVNTAGVYTVTVTDASTGCSDRTPHSAINCHFVKFCNLFMEHFINRIGNYCEHCRCVYGYSY